MRLRKPLKGRGGESGTPDTTVEPSGGVVGNETLIRKGGHLTTHVKCSQSSLCCWLLVCTGKYQYDGCSVPGCVIVLWLGCWL